MPLLDAVVLPEVFVPVMETASPDDLAEVIVLVPAPAIRTP
jgi:hypothetical protein